MARRWKTVRVFVSSDFRGMIAERDHLVRLVIPELKERCLKKRVHLIDVALRRGATEKDAQEGTARDIYLGESDAFRPYFTGLLGQCYDSISESRNHALAAEEFCHRVLHNVLPKQIVDLRSIIEGRLVGQRLSAEQTSAFVRCYPWDADKRKYLLRSDITADDKRTLLSVFEQYFASQKDRSFFLFRAESLCRQLTGDKAPDFIDSSPEYADKVAGIKREITAAGLHYREYDSIEAFGQMALEILWGRIYSEVEQALDTLSGLRAINALAWIKRQFSQVAAMIPESAGLFFFDEIGIGGVCTHPDVMEANPRWSSLKEAFDSARGIPEGFLLAAVEQQNNSERLLVAW